jgi:hypothetical protein
VRIRRSDLKGPDVLVARLCGSVRTEVATVRSRGRYYFVAPRRLGGVREVPADSLTDALHAAVWGLRRVRAEK